MLYDWQLSYHFGLEHLHHALGNFVPVRHHTNVVKNGGTLSERDSLLDLLNEGDAPEIHVVVLFLLDCTL